jgi:hypothetical protein
MVPPRRYGAILCLFTLVSVAWVLETTWRVALVLVGTGAILLILCLSVRTEGLRAILLAVSSVLISVSLFEFVVRVSAPTSYASIRYEHGYNSTDGPLGKGPRGPAQYRSSARKTDDGQPIYDVVYTIDENGFRKTRGGGKGADTFLFFGGSFTYGEGVADDETYPARFSEELGDRFTVVNLSFHGYGPHQMLRALELGLADSSITGRVRNVVYLAIADHANRAAGFHWWNRHTPRYSMKEGGGVEFSGFHDELWGVRALAELEKLGGVAALATAALREFVHPPEDRIQLAAAIVEESASLAARKYGAGFLCVLWDGEETERVHLLRRFEDELRSRGLEVVRVSRWLGDVDQPAYRIRAGVENHPNALAYHKLGQALGRHLGDGGRVVPD